MAPNCLDVFTYIGSLSIVAVVSASVLLMHNLLATHKKRCYTETSEIALDVSTEADHSIGVYIL